MNQEFINWLEQQTYNFNSGGWYVVEVEYDDFGYWCWTDILEWDE